MEKPPAQEVTALLREWAAGDRAALERLMPIVYGELRRLAASQLRAERREHTLQPTALVHEAYLRLVGQRSVSWANRAHFFAIAAEMMRRVLVDHARKRRAAKRNPETVYLDLGPSEIRGGDRPPDLLALDAALTRLERLDARQARVEDRARLPAARDRARSRAVTFRSAMTPDEWRRVKTILEGVLDQPLE